MTLTRSVAFKPLRYSAVFLATLCILFGQSIDVAGELVARWEFNEGKGNTVKDSSGKGHERLRRWGSTVGTWCCGQCIGV